MTESPVTPIPAATVALVRDTESGLEVLLMRRNANSAFVPGAYVFPGGAVDPADSSADMQALACGVSDAAASAVLGVPHGGLAYWIAAIREAFEESGLLLAYDAEQRVLELDVEAQIERFREHRDALNRAQRNINDIFVSERLTLAIDQLVYFAHWITPAHAPRRYDARFFVALAPARQVALHDDHEMVAHLWVAPRLALERHRSGDFLLRTPTLHTLEEFAAYSSVAEVMAAMRSKRAIPTFPAQLGAAGALGVTPRGQYAK